MISRPLTRLLKKGSYEWNSAAQVAFEALKQAMISAPVLKLPDFTKEFTVETDASGGGIRAVLLQEGHPIAFLSKTLSAKHQLMSTYEKEFLAVVVALEKWRGYLLDRRFKIKTNHISLKYLMDQRMSTPTQLKWLPKLMGFDFAIVYKKGVDNVIADALSRLHNPVALLSIIGTTTVTTDLYNRIVDSWEQDQTLKALISKLKLSSNTHGYYTWHNQQLRRKGKLMVGNNEAVRTELLQQTMLYVLLEENEKRSLPKSQGKDVILVVVDRLSKYSHFMALSHPFTASQVAQLFLDDVYKLHGLPENIVYLECYLRCMTGEQAKQWAKWLPLAEWWYNTNFHTSIHTTPYEAVYGKPLPVHIPYIGGESKVDLVDKTLSEREEVVEALKFHISRAQSRMKSHANKGRTDRKFDCGDWVFLKLQPHRQVSLRQGKQNKFSPKFFGPFKVIQRIGEVAYKLDLPSNSQIHNVFHVSQLRKCRHPNPDQTSGTLPPCDSSGVFLVEPLTILDRRMAKKGNGMEIYVLVQWTNGTIEDATWESVTELQSKFRSKFPTFDCTA
ncbi:transposon ty3-I gag-pol polyprotein [Tanacetum coccineum]